MVMLVNQLARGPATVLAASFNRVATVAIRGRDRRGLAANAPMALAAGSTGRFLASTTAISTCCENQSLSLALQVLRQTPLLLRLLLCGLVAAFTCIGHGAIPPGRPRRLVMLTLSAPVFKVKNAKTWV